jgi:hypothetical protein
VKEFFETKARYLKLNLQVPHESMYEEAKKLKNRFSEHRGDENNKGWKSLALYGLDEHRHENWADYGYATAADAAKDFKWTDAAKECPTIMQFLNTIFPSKKFGRVRLMLIEAGGYIGMHNDSESRIYLTENINIPLNNPKECLWHWGDGHPDLFMEPGGVYAMNITYDHSVTNNSNLDRYHLIVARHDSTAEWKQLIVDAARQQGEQGNFIVLNALP